MMGTPTSPLNMFYAYAKEDTLWRKQLDRHLTALHIQGLIVGWHEGNISPGTERDQAIKKHLDAADLIFLLISPDFLASPFCSGLALTTTLECHHRGDTRIIPILLRPVDLTGTRLSELQPLPGNGKPISRWPDPDEVWMDVLREIRAVIEERRPATSGPWSSSPGASGSKAIWHVPYRHNPFFTGREQLLTRLRERLTTTNAAALTQPQAISGLGGIGKTQTAPEYAYRYRTEYRAVL